MTMDGFAFGFTSADMSAPGGRRKRRLLIVAESMEQAESLNRGAGIGAVFEERGPAVLERARAIGVKDNDGQVDG